MMDRKLKEKLNQYAVPAYSEKALEETLLKAHGMTGRISFRMSTKRMNAGRFFLDQFRFVRSYTWLLKGGMALLAAACLPESINGSEIWLWMFLSIAGPFLCLINANELWGFFQPGLIEIQMTAKYSLRQVLMTRLTLFGLIDALVFGAAAAGMSASGNGAAWQVLLYSTVPYLLMCAGCMVIFRKVREENAVFYCGAWAVLLAAGILLMNSLGWRIYETDTVSGWLVTGAAALAGAVWQTVELIQQTGGNVDEINIGTTV